MFIMQISKGSRSFGKHRIKKEKHDETQNCYIQKEATVESNINVSK